MQRFSLFHVISGEEQDIPIAARSARWREGEGAACASLVPASSVDHVFICGPTGMSEDMRRPAGDIGIAEDRIHVERFVSGSAATASRGLHTRECAAEGGCRACYRRQTPRGAGRRGRVILDAHARRHGSAVRLQRRMCSTCRAQSRSRVKRRWR